MSSVLVLDKKNIVSIPLSQTTTDQHSYRILRPGFCFGISLKNHKGANTHPWDILQDYIEQFSKKGVATITKETLDDLKNSYLGVNQQIVLPRIVKEEYVPLEGVARYQTYALSAENLYKAEKEIKNILNFHQQYERKLNEIFKVLEDAYATKKIKFSLTKDSSVIDFKALKNFLQPSLAPKEEKLVKEWALKFKDPNFLSNSPKIDLSLALLNNYLKPLLDITAITSKSQSYIKLVGSYKNKSIGIMGTSRGQIYNSPDKIEEIYFTKHKANLDAASAANKKSLLEDYINYVGYYEYGILKDISVPTQLQVNKNYASHVAFTQELNLYIEKLNLEAQFPVATSKIVDKPKSGRIPKI